MFVIFTFKRRENFHASGQTALSRNVENFVVKVFFPRDMCQSRITDPLKKKKMSFLHYISPGMLYKIYPNVSPHISLS